MADGLVVEVTGRRRRLGAAGRDPPRRPLDARRRSPRWAPSRPGCGSPAATRSRTPAGLGSSSAAIVGGVALARALVAGRRRLGSTTTRPVPAGRGARGASRQRRAGGYGGFVISGTGGRRVVRRPARRRRPGRAPWCSCPPDPLSTEVARGLLPDTVPHADAAADAGRAALLVAALAGAPEHLLAGHPRLPAPGAAPPGDARLAGPRRPAARRRAGRGRVRRRPDRAGPRGLQRGLARPTWPARCPDGWEHHVLLVAPEGVRRR